MSGWDSYVYGMMKDTGLFEDACIFGIEDLHIWATTTNFNLTPSEMATLLEIAQEDFKKPPKQISIQGAKYNPVLSEKDRIYAEKDNNTSSGLLVLLGKACAVVGTYPDSVQVGLAVDAIEKLLIYLKEQGF